MEAESKAKIKIYSVNVKMQYRYAKSIWKCMYNGDSIKHITFNKVKIFIIL